MLETIFYQFLELKRHSIMIFGALRIFNSSLPLEHYLSIQDRQE